MMRMASWRIGWVGVALLSACAPQPLVTPEGAEPVAPLAEEKPHVVIPPPPRPVAARQSLEFTKSRSGGVLMQGVAFDARGYRMQMVDQKNGPGSEFADAAAVARARGGIAAVNAGFFTLEGEPLGLVMAEGVKAGAWNSASSLGSGLWLEDRLGGMSIARRSAEMRSNAASMRNLLQSGPLLMERGQIVGGLERSKNSARTFLLWDGGQRWWMGCASPVTLAGLAHILANDPPVVWKPRMALNLDGGRSSELWVSSSFAGAETTTRLPWNRPVRNFLVLVPKG
jgi:hypothetical protein